MTDPAGVRKRDRGAGAPGPLPDPRLPRAGETIGGGWFVFRRGRGSGRIRAPEYPFEHATRAAAEAECRRLAAKFPQHRFEVLGRP